MPHSGKKFKPITPLDIQNLVDKCSGYHSSFLRCMADSFNDILRERLGIPDPKFIPKPLVERKEPECKS